jgi:hypothetical protein
LVYDERGELPIDKLAEKFKFSLDESDLDEKIQRVTYQDGDCNFYWDEVKPIPTEDSWFESVWNKYMNDEIIK